MAKKRSGLILGIFIFVILIQGLIFIGAQEAQLRYCAEKTLSGAWCQSVSEDQIDNSINPSTDQRYRSAQTSCDSTTYCKLGTCIDSIEGTCDPNTPQAACQKEGGVWDERDFDEIPQCQLGCCFLGDEASFTTQTRCTALSSDYGLQTNFRADIRDENTCIASANPREEGACVFEEEFQTTCQRLTRSECQNLESQKPSANVEFYEETLCSAERLGTICGPSQQTTCVEDKDEVRFLDTCGNLANVYDASRVNDQTYWTDIISPEESCNPSSSNANSASCGNCAYRAGSTCKAFERGETANPQYGDFICKDLGCEWEGERYEHGESWCTTNSETNQEENVPGEQHFRMSCVNNEVTFESCSVFRNEICAEEEIREDYTYGACKINVWWECALVDNKDDCEDIEVRDCRWVEGQTNAIFFDEETGKKYVVNNQGKLVQESETNSREQASCIPKYTPGFKFWADEETVILPGEDTGGEEQTAVEWCGIGNDIIFVKFEDPLGSDWRCVENCDYIDSRDRKNTHPTDARVNPNFVEERNSLCTSLGDCGSSINYHGIEGEEFNIDEITSFKEVEE